MIKGILASIFVIFASQIFSQAINGCDGIRYVKEVFTDVDKHTVKFGENTDAQGKFHELFMDVYTPVDDVIEFRPVLIWVFGGAFISGEREDMAPYCEEFAKLGYVTATIDYRIWDLTGGFPDSIDGMNIAVMAMGDLKASIRHLRQSYDEGNPYGIDPDNIIVGGLSAGSITAILAGIVDEDDDVNEFFSTIIDANGGLEGNSGDALNQSYSSDILAMINLSGAIYDTSWIDENDPPILSFHGTADQTVKFGFGYASVLNFQVIQLHGSGNIQSRQEHLGKNTFLKAVEGGNHYSVYLDAQYEDDRQEFSEMVRLYLYDLICGAIPLSSEMATWEEINALVAPNPVSEILYLKNEKIIDYLSLKIVDLQGRNVLLKSFDFVDDIQIPLEQFRSGVYFLILQDMNHPGISQTIRFVKL